jgi:hypothetical protein
VNISRGDDNLYLVDLKTKKETLLTPHTGPGAFSGRFSPTLAPSISNPTRIATSLRSDGSESQPMEASDRSS